MANDASEGSLSQKVERYFSLLILFINGQSMISNDVNYDDKLIFDLQITGPSVSLQCPHFFLKCPHFVKSPGTLSSVMKFLGRTLWYGHLECSNGAVKTAFDIQVYGKHGPGRPKMTQRQLT